MKVICMLMIFAVTSASHSKDLNIQPMPDNNDCFSSANFDLVYHHIRKSIAKEKSAFYTCEKYQLHLGCAAEITIKQDGYTLAIISRETGIYSLAKVLSDNNRLVDVANELFCKVLGVSIGN